MDLVGAFVLGVAVGLALSALLGLAFGLVLAVW